MKKNFLVIGGGVAGQFTGLAYKKQFPDSDVTIIYSKDIPIIGVGESGLVDLARFLFEMLEIDINSFYRQVTPLHKLGVSFRDWYKVGYTYNYAFDGYITTSLLGCDIAEFPIETKTFASTMMHKNMCPVSKEGWFFGGISSFQIENKKFVPFLENVALERDIKILNKEISFIKFTDDSQQQIDYIKYKNDDTEYRYDFYLDASGFNGVINNYKQNEFVNFKPWLPCDKAIVGQHELTETDPRHSYTISWRMSNGWMWQIDCPYRTGKGYVFDSTTQSIESATEEYIEKNKGRVKDPRVIDFKTGFYKKMFGRNFALVGNCQGFAEPLESTGFSMIISSIQEVINLQKVNDELELSEIKIKFLNSIIQEKWWEIVDFLTLHYKYNYDIDNTFWNFCNNELKMREGMENFIEFVKENNLMIQTEPYDIKPQVAKEFFPKSSMFTISDIYFHLISKNLTKPKKNKIDINKLVEFYKETCDRFYQDKELIEFHNKINFRDLYTIKTKHFQRLLFESGIKLKL
jgi:tryptophan halogenase